MNEFSLGGAWTKGFGFFSGQAANHAIILIGVGIAAPFAIQYLLLGGATSMMNPATLAQGGLGAITAMGGPILLGSMLVSYVMQMGSYFGSWRLGFGQGESLAGAIVYGLAAGLMVVLVFAVIAAIGIALIQASPVVGALLIVIALLPLFAMLYTTIAATIAIGFVIVLLIGLAVGGAASSTVPIPAGGTVALFIVFGIAALLLWLTARFSCTTAILARRKSYNLIDAVGESWRITAASQWRLTLYLGLLGFVLLIVYFVFGAVIGVGVMASMRGGGVPQVGLGVALVSLILAVPFAYLTVLVPAGIYRELVPADLAAAEVFA